MATTTATLWVGNDNLVEVSGLKPATSDTFDSSATVQATVLDSQGSEVTGQSWPVTLTYVTDSDGVYHATLSADMDISAGKRYTIKIEGASQGLAFEWRCQVVAQIRRCD